MYKLLHPVKKPVSALQNLDTENTIFGAIDAGLDGILNGTTSIIDQNCSASCADYADKTQKALTDVNNAAVAANWAYNLSKQGSLVILI